MVYLLLKSFRLKAVVAGIEPTPATTCPDRTGLDARHPELLNENGEFLAANDPWAVRFSGLAGDKATGAYSSDYPR